MSKSFLTQLTTYHFDHLNEIATCLQFKVPIPICHTYDPTISLGYIVNIVICFLVIDLNIWNLGWWYGIEQSMES